MRSRALPPVLAMLSLLAAMPPAEAFSFSVEPSRIELQVPAGKRRGKSITVDNSKSSAPVHIKVYVQDVIYLPDGTHEFPEAGSTAWSCATWIQISPTELDIPAGSTAEVRVSVTAPENAAGGHYAIVFFESRPTYESGVGINFRIGALVEAVTPGTEQRQAKLSNMAFQPPQELALELFNEGNVLIRPGGKIKLYNAEGKRITQFDFNPSRLGVLPNTARRYVEKFPNPLIPGSYRIRAEIDYGTKYLLVGELPFTVQ